jgi:hypothetical protein
MRKSLAIPFFGLLAFFLGTGSEGRFDVPDATDVEGEGLRMPAGREDPPARSASPPSIVTSSSSLDVSIRSTKKTPAACTAWRFLKNEALDR